MYDIDILMKGGLHDFTDCFSYCGRDIECLRGSNFILLFFGGFS